MKNEGVVAAGEEEVGKNSTEDALNEAFTKDIPSSIAMAWTENNEDAVDIKERSLSHEQPQDPIYLSGSVLCPNGFEHATQTSGLNGNLNQGTTNSKHIFLCLALHRRKVTRLKMQQNRTCGDGWDMVPFDYALGGLTGNLNQGTDGKVIILCYTKADDAADEDVIYDIHLQSSRPPDNELPERPDGLDGSSNEDATGGKAIYLALKRPGSVPVPVPVPVPPGGVLRYVYPMNYWQNEELLNFQSHLNKAREMGGDLVSIHSQDEYDYLASMYNASWIGFSLDEQIMCYNTNNTWCDGSPKNDSLDIFNPVQLQRDWEGTVDYLDSRVNFNDWDEINFFTSTRITKIEMRFWEDMYFKFMYSIKTLYEDNFGNETISSHGGNGGYLETFELDNDEYVTEVGVGKAGNFIDAMQFHTNKRSSGKFGPGVINKTFKREGMVIESFYGQLSLGIYDIGVQFRDAGLSGKCFQVVDDTWHKSRDLCQNQKKGLYLIPDYNFDLLHEERSVGGKCVYTSKVYMSKQQHTEIANHLGGSLDNDEIRDGHFSNTTYMFECDPKPLPTHGRVHAYSQYLYFQRQEMNDWFQHHRIANDWGGDLASIHSKQENDFLQTLSDSETSWIGGRRMINYTDKNNEMWTWSDGSDWDYTKWSEGDPDNASSKGKVQILSGWHDALGFEPESSLMKFQKPSDVCLKIKSPNGNIDGNYQPYLWFYIEPVTESIILPVPSQALYKICPKDSSAICGTSKNSYFVSGILINSALGTVHEVKHPSQGTYGNKLHVHTCLVTYEVNDEYLAFEEHMEKALKQGSYLASIQGHYDYGRIHTLTSLNMDQPYWLGGEVVNGNWVWSDGTAWNPGTFVVSGDTGTGNALTLKNTQVGSPIASSITSASLPAIYQKVNLVQALVNGKDVLYFGPLEAPDVHPDYVATSFNGTYRIKPDGIQVELWGNKLIRLNILSPIGEENLNQGQIMFDIILHDDNVDVFFETDGLVEKLANKNDDNKNKIDQLQRFQKNVDNSNPTISFASITDSFVKAVTISNIWVNSYTPHGCPADTLPIALKTDNQSYEMVILCKNATEVAQL
mmetsp:Transcript_3693/g.4706  ORF Transcript_3693/g.4706 Transcript_3693/m.4706 type:complete len:1076 (-) Transcript_3693:128-3355(-)